MNQQSWNREIESETRQAIEDHFAGCQLARSAALSELLAFLKNEKFALAVIESLGASSPSAAIIEWSKRRGEQWRPFDSRFENLGDD